ncbi:MAG: sigma-70 family RNA polymerase sigma factor [Burkholderiales bacterium]
MAIWAGAETAVRLHIARGDDLNATDESGLTPLMIAAARNKSAVCRLLIEAGANLATLDRTGRSALEIAIAHSATDAACVIEVALSQQTLQVVPVAVPLFELTVAMVTGSLETSGASPTAADLGRAEAERVEPAVSDALPVQLDFDDDGEPLELSGWEPEAESKPPTDDRPAVVAHVATQEAIGRHVAPDNSAGWADFEADLPFQAAPLLRAQDAEGRVEIRALLLRAIREGSVPELAIENVCRDADGARNQATEALLCVVINDLGAESDERFECRSPFDSSEAFVDPEESAEESETVDEALGFLDNLRSRNNEPIRLYMREAQRTILLSAEEEVELAREMGRAVDAAIDALSHWRGGLECLRLAIASARRGERSINSIVSSAREAASPVEEAAGVDDLNSVESGVTVVPPNPSFGQDDEEVELGQMTAEDETLDAFALADELARLLEAERSGSQVRDALASISLRRSFLIGLCDSAADGSTEAATYARAIRSLMALRGRMVRANLRLVISLAKRYMYAGVPMDDLIQDGNIGLLNAVDKFDWRRGFRFSTMATWWIRQQISRSIADSSLAIRLPVHVYEIAQHFPRAAEAFEKETGRLPTIQQLAKLVGHDWKKVETLIRASSAPLPIDALDNEPNLNAFNPEPFEAISAMELRKTLDDLLVELGARPEKIVRLRYGMGVDEPQTLEEIGALFDVTRERIRQIESKALTKLKHPTRLVRLLEWSLDPERRRPSEPSAPPNPDDDGEDVASADPVPNPPRASVARAPTVARTEGGKRLTPVERVLRQAALLDISVEQTTRGEETTTWVSLTKSTDNRHRKLIRSLMALGFEYWPGKGYWR